MNNRTILILILSIAIFAGITGCIASGENTSVTNESDSALTDVVRDPVCGMTVDPKTTEFSETFEGKTYYFCIAMCKDVFAEDPSKFLSGEMKGTVIDPVCLMKFSPDIAEGNTTFNGVEYYFCSPDCKVSFDKNPGKYLQVSDPVCGMKVDSLVAVHTMYKGATYFFCCSKCKSKFEKDPDKYLTAVDKTSAVDLVCDMTVDPKTAESYEYNGNMYYFCSAMCKDVFEKDPRSFLMKYYFLY